MPTIWLSILFFYLQFCLGILGCWRYRLLYAQLLRSSSTIRYENIGHLPKRSDSFVSSSGVFQLLLPVLLAKYGSVGTTRKSNRLDWTRMVANSWHSPDNIHSLASQHNFLYRLGHYAIHVSLLRTKAAKQCYASKVQSAHSRCAVTLNSR